MRDGHVSAHEFGRVSIRSMAVIDPAEILAKPGSYEKSVELLEQHFDLSRQLGFSLRRLALADQGASRFRLYLRPDP